MNTYDCDYCIANELYSGRACYLTDFPGKESYFLKVPVFDEESTNKNPVGEEERDLSLDDIYDLMEEWETIFPDMPPFEMIQTWFRYPLEVCPTSLVDPYYAFMLEAEASCREYKVLPYDGGLWDQPLALIQAFETIRTERNHFERIRIDRMEQKAKKDHSGTKQLPSRQLPGTAKFTNPQ